jgi:enoyl-CoA hydratase/carnithine racemase
MSDPVLLERRDRAFWITLNRPEKRNALNAAVLAGVVDGLRRAHADPEVRVVVLTGAGDKAFCAGADLSAGGPLAESSGLGSRPPSPPALAPGAPPPARPPLGHQPGGAFAFNPARPGSSAYAELLRVGAGAALPTIARVNGACLAGGMGLLAMVDLAVAADTATFGLPEVKAGLFPMQVLSLLQALVPPRVLRGWCLGGEPFDAETARAAGLVNEVVPAAELDARTAALAERLASRSPTALRRGKHALRVMAELGFAEALAFAQDEIALLSLTEDAREGIAAYNERRPPDFSGR